MSLRTQRQSQQTTARKGDLFRLTARVGSHRTELVGKLVRGIWMDDILPSRVAKQRGYVKEDSKRTGVVLGLKVKGFEKLFWKWRSQVKPIGRETPT